AVLQISYGNITNFCTTGGDVMQTTDLSQLSGIISFGYTRVTGTTNVLDLGDDGTIHLASSDSGTYKITVVVTGFDSSTSPSLIIQIDHPPAITGQPAIQIVCANGSATFTVTASGTNNTYQWFRGATMLTNGGNISGATSATLTINPATATDADV